jgi:hypothetical protein
VRCRDDQTCGRRCEPTFLKVKKIVCIRIIFYFLCCPNSLIPLHSNTAPLWRYNVASSKRTYVGLNVNFATFLYDFNQISRFAADFNEGFHYQISRKHIWWESCSYIRTDRRRDRRKDTKVTGTSREYANEPEKMKFPGTLHEGMWRVRIYVFVHCI